MKKSFLMFGVAVMALASCTNEEVLNVADSRAISFDNAFVNNGTRSQADPSLTTGDLANFDVYGFVTNQSSQTQQIFDGTKIIKSGSNWTYDNPDATQYWVSGNTYTFAAIAPSEAGTVSSEAVNGGKITMSVEFDNSDTDQKDLLYAAPGAIDVADDDYKTAVPLTFDHLLSKVRFSFTNSVGADYKVKVSDVQISDAMMKGTFTVGTSENKWVATSNNLKLNFGDAVADDTDEEADAIAYNGTNETYNEKLMIPTGTETSYTVKFTVELLQGNVPVGTYTHTVTISNVELKSGYCYDFTAELTHDNVLDPDHSLNPINFTVNKVNEWDDTDEKQGLNVSTTQG